MYINELAKLSGVSQRTLRYYDEIGLLVPDEVDANGYRNYSETNVNELQQILFYKELGFSLSHIQKILQSDMHDRKQTLIAQQKLLAEKQAHLGRLIDTIEKTILCIEGELHMTNEDKFTAFKNNLIEENEQQYGEESRQKYGEEAFRGAQKNLQNLTEEQFQAMTQLEQQLFSRLTEGLQNTNQDILKEIGELHKRWLAFNWTTYTKEAHLGLSQMYLADDRFTAYYDEKVSKGATALLAEAIEHFTQSL